ncbi:hypothetical protein [Nonomuraea sp. NEAU-A123]|uniref:hypothetical protein n=1 Tax=Nonomuraea sp. NEAU-A123 TaxID=2839649 RepID=UPI001BE46CF6|nr:hypothetical protein [Nonomuraea sp. NEAU-A123]MBT2230435.1 hypothetical protein [Nonomuraea sp. NEAU-A123]
MRSPCTDHIPLADAAEAIHRLEHKIGDPIRLILIPDDRGRTAKATEDTLCAP